MATEIRVPTLGESVTEATVGKWFKKVGDTIAADEPLVELETDKVTVEVPAAGGGPIEPRTMPPAPAAAKLIAENNLAVDHLPGSGKRGQVLKGDVLDAI